MCLQRIDSGGDVFGQVLDFGIEVVVKKERQAGSGSGACATQRSAGGADLRTAGTKRGRVGQVGASRPKRTRRGARRLLDVAAVTCCRHRAVAGGCRRSSGGQVVAAPVYDEVEVTPGRFPIANWCRCLADRRLLGTVTSSTLDRSVARQLDHVGGLVGERTDEDRVEQAGVEVRKVIVWPAAGRRR